jgi:cytochrome c-type biogenesis protein
VTDVTGTVSWGVAAVAGLLSFLSPCVAPLVPGYLSFVAGAAIGPVAGGPRQTERVLIASGLFVLGFSAVFVALGATAGLIGGLLEPHRATLSRLSGVVMIAMGLFVLGLVRAPFLYREHRFHFIDRPSGAIGTVLLGMAFGFGWTPCIGPILASILLYAGSAETAQEGALLLLAYSVGLGVPFLVVALGLSRAVGGFDWLKRHLAPINAASGALLVGMGTLFAANQAYYLTYMNVATQRLLEAVAR